MRVFRLLSVISTAAALASAGNVVRIDSIELLDPQPHSTDPAVIWYDSFDRPSQQYFEQKGSLSSDRFGTQSDSPDYSTRCIVHIVLIKENLIAFIGMRKILEVKYMFECLCLNVPYCNGTISVG